MDGSISPFDRGFVADALIVLYTPDETALMWLVQQ